MIYAVAIYALLGAGVAVKYDAITNSSDYPVSVRWIAGCIVAVLWPVFWVVRSMK